MTTLTPPLPLPERPHPILTAYYRENEYAAYAFTPFGDAWLDEHGGLRPTTAGELLDNSDWRHGTNREVALRLIPSLLFATSWRPLVKWEHGTMLWNDVDHVMLPDTTNLALRAFLMEALHAHDQAPA